MTVNMLVKQFASQLEDLVTRMIHDRVAARLDEIRDHMVGKSPSFKIRPHANKAVHRGMMAKMRTWTPEQGRQSLVEAGVLPKAYPARGAYKAKPCPVPGCGTVNRVRRYSFLCDTHRNPSNIAKFQGVPNPVLPSRSPKTDRATA